MRVTVYLHASLKDAAGTESALIDLDAEAVPCTAVKLALAKVFPKLQGQLRQARLAVEQEIVPDSHLLKDGQRVDVLPPFSGG